MMLLSNKLYLHRFTVIRLILNGCWIAILCAFLFFAIIRDLKFSYYFNFDGLNMQIQWYPQPTFIVSFTFIKSKTFNEMREREKEREREKSIKLFNCRIINGFEYFSPHQISPEIRIVYCPPFFSHSFSLVLCDCMTRQQMSDWHSNENPNFLINAIYSINDGQCSHVASLKLVNIIPLFVRWSIVTCAFSPSLSFSISGFFFLLQCSIFRTCFNDSMLYTFFLCPSCNRIACF